MNRGRQILLGTLTIFILLLGEALSLSIPKFGNFGRNPDEAEKTDFFRWFHLHQTGVVSRDGGRVISFKPSGRKFRHLVTVKITTASGEIIRAMEVVLNRSFIDDPQEGIFARDIAKSFLFTGLTAPRDRQITDLINEIQYQGTSGMTVLRSKSYQVPKLPAKPTPGYQVYLGKKPEYEHSIPGFLLRLENTTREGVPVFVAAIKRDVT